MHSSNKPRVSFKSFLRAPPLNEFMYCWAPDYTRTAQELQTELAQARAMQQAAETGQATSSNLRAAAEESLQDLQRKVCLAVVMQSFPLSMEFMHAFVCCSWQTWNAKRTRRRQLQQSQVKSLSQHKHS